jgi:hypothetical protein
MRPAESVPLRASRCRGVIRAELVVPEPLSDRQRAAITAMLRSETTHHLPTKSRKWTAIDWGPTYKRRRVEPCLSPHLLCSSRQSLLLTHSGRISTSETGRNRSAGALPSERQLSTASVSKAVIPLTADFVEELDAGLLVGGLGPSRGARQRLVGAAQVAMAAVAGMSLASFRRFWAVAARRNSS